MEDKNDIFIKHNEKTVSSLSKKEILDSIPKDSLKTPNEFLGKIKTEWRWRIFKIPGKDNEIIEISYKKKDQSRMFINNSGEWVSTNVDQSFDKFVINQFYSYSD